MRINRATFLANANPGSAVKRARRVVSCGNDSSVLERELLGAHRSAVVDERATAASRFVAPSVVAPSCVLILPAGDMAGEACCEPSVTMLFNFVSEKPNCSPLGFSFVKAIAAFNSLLFLSNRFHCEAEIRP